MRIILLSTAAAILAGCASLTPPLCDREEQPWLKFGTTTDDCAAPVAFVRPDTSGDGFVMPSSPRPEPRPETPIIEPPKPPHLDREDPPAKPEPEPEKPQPPSKPDHPKHDKPKDDNGHGNDPDKHDESNPGKGKGSDK
jgi:hypothetical protein